jgi:uncharacterized membrane protein
MTSYAIGMVVGRLLASYLIVLLVLYLFAKFQHKVAFKRSIKWYGILLTFAVFIAGVAASVAR